jgi:hypothetical protein
MRGLDEPGSIELNNFLLVTEKDPVEPLGGSGVWATKPSWHRYVSEASMERDPQRHAPEWRDRANSLVMILNVILLLLRIAKILFIW